MSVLGVDFETYGTVELKRSGVYPYAKHHDTGIWCMAWAFDDEEPALWLPGQSLPERIVAHIAADGELRAWNAAFERIMWRDCAARKWGWPIPRDEQWHCTMAEACAMALPRSLDYCAQVLRLPINKDAVGKKLMLKMCRPRRFDPDSGEPVWWDELGNIKRLGEYCLQDVRVERSVYQLTRRLGANEREKYLLDQKMNDRGVQLDRDLVIKARELAEREIEWQNALLSEATDGQVGSVTKVAKLKEWLATQGLATETLNKQALAELLDDSVQLAPNVRAALEARQEAGKSSLAKLDAMLDCVGRDNRCRGLLLYHGASTGRWSGKLIQPQNFTRGELKPDEIEPLIEWIKSEPRRLMASTAAVDRLGLLTALSSMLRGCLIAAPGQRLFCADFAAIEARVLGWVANSQLMLAQFRDGKPIYKEMAGVIYHRPPAEIVKPSEEYQLGKNTVLGCGFGMGEKTFAKTTGVTPEVARTAVYAYRDTYPEVPRYWNKVNTAALDAVEHPGQVCMIPGSPRTVFVKRGGYLWIVLPSGRALAYAAPKIVDRQTPWGEMRPAVEYSGVNSYTHKWERMALYGGLITENIVQAIARDLMADAMVRVEQAGYPVILTVHDEIVSEASVGELSAFVDLVKTVSLWATGCPVDAEGWVGERYRK